MKSIEYAKIKRIPITAISVFTKQSKNKINEIYNFFKEHNISFRLNPVVSSKRTQNFIITPAEYADAIIELIDIYLSDPDDLIKIVNIDQYIQILYSNMLRLSNDKKLISLDFYDF